MRPSSMAICAVHSGISMAIRHRVRLNCAMSISSAIVDSDLVAPDPVSYRVGRI